MCNKTSYPRGDEKISSFVNVRRSKRKTKTKQISSSDLNPSSRKTRTKTRKPKYLSLKLELNSSSSQNNSKMTKQQENQLKQQLNLFPLHPEKLVDQDESDNYQYDTVSAYLLNDYSTNDTTISAIHELLDNNTTTTSEEGPLSPPSSLTYGSYGDHLVRTAIRCKEREESEEERWVCYAEVMSTTTRCGGDAAEGDADADRAVEGKRLLSSSSLALKLDYQQILNAWSDKGPLYIDGETPLQTVPDLHAVAGGANLLMDEWDNVGNVWRVPEMASNVGGGFKTGEEIDAKENWKKGKREASVLRYKEKRQSRLFSNRIRYEVRKLNAEKRPRMKIYPSPNSLLFLFKTMTTQIKIKTLL